MNDYIALDVAYTSKAIDAMLKAYPELMDDEELRSDMLEAETSLPAVASKIIRARQERLAMAEGLNLYIKDLTERRDRLSRGADGLKGLLLKLMATAKLPTLPLPEATVSVRAGNTSVSITDLDELPQGFFTEEVRRVPRKDALKLALEAGADVPGAALVTGENVLTVRVK
jgi:hypothetical protein